MHCNTNLIKGALFVLFPLVLFSACSQTSNGGLTDVDDNGGYASDASRIEWANNDVISLADAAGEVYNSAYMRTTHTTLGTCATVATDTISTPHTLIIRFGTQDCACLDGRNRKGSIIISYNGEYSDSGQVHTITFDNYNINDNQLTGTIETIRVDTTVVTGHWYYDVLVNDSMNISQSPLNSQYVVWSGSLVRKWVSGITTGDRSDDAFSISGSATLTRANGHQFTFNMSSPIQFAMNCNYAESGIITVNGYEGSRVLNYGSGNCDALAQVNIGANVYNITLTP
jgi:hypothetical protein